MIKTLIVVESPHKAKTISGFLDPNEYIVLASIGHFVELGHGGHLGLGVDIEKDFKPRYVLMKDKIKILDDILNAAKECDQILIASDADREGEAIAWHLQQRLQDFDKPIKRITFQEITKKAIDNSLKNPKDINLSLVKAQQTRQILDRLVGFIASPFLMNFFGNNLSAGRVQSVVTRLVVDREKEIADFIPSPYWTIQTNLQKEDVSFTAKFEKVLTDEKEANFIFNKLKGNEYDTSFIVSDIIAKDEKKSPPAPLITSTLQQIMSKQYKMDAAAVMKAAQTLYDQGYISYLRTDSTTISEEAMVMVRDWLKDNKHPMPKSPNIYDSKKSADAHECIRPTDISLLPDENNFAIIDPDEKKVYEVIWKYFVASQMNPAVYSTLKVTIHPKDNPKIKLKSSGKTLKSKGFYEILGIDDKSKIDIPSLVKGEEIVFSKKSPLSLDKKMTSPPARYSAEKLIKELDNKGIGRPATYAEILSKICNRNYVEKHGEIYHATDLGNKINNVLVSYFKFMDINYTAKLEMELDLIADSKKESLDVLKSFYEEFRESVKKAYEGQNHSIIEDSGSLFILKKGKYGDFYSCIDAPNKKLNIALQQ